MSGEQLVFDLAEPARDEPDSFVTGPSTAAARAALARWRDWPGRTLIVLAPADAGKSHLSRVWARSAGGRVIARAVFAEAAPSVIAASRAAPLAVEDLDRGVDERALLSLLDEARSGSAAGVLLTARTSPAAWPIALGDLRSRLLAAPVVGFQALDDREFEELIAQLLKARGLDANASLIEYLMRRVERSTPAAVAIVRRLDQASLSRRAPVTRVLARAVLGGEAEEDDPGDEHENRLADEHDPGADAR